MTKPKPKIALPEGAPRPKHPGGRPPVPQKPRPARPVFNNREELKDEIVEWIGSGRTMSDYCRQPGKPQPLTIYDWLAADPEFDRAVGRARDAGYDVIAEDALRIANTPVEGKRVKRSEDGTETVIEDMLGHRKLQVETRLKLLACWNPRKYGNKQLVGQDPENPLPQSASSTLIDEVLKGLALQRQKELQASKSKK